MKRHTGLDPGRLRHRVLIQRPDTYETTGGEVMQQWEPVGMVWAAIEPMSARERILADSMQSDVTTRIVIRYRAGVDASMRIIHRGQVYDITGVIPDPVSGLEYLTLPCRVGASLG